MGLSLGVPGPVLTEFQKWTGPGESQRDPRMQPSTLGPEDTEDGGRLHSCAVRAQRGPGPAQGHTVLP